MHGLLQVGRGSAQQPQVARSQHVLGFTKVISDARLCDAEPRHAASRGRACGAQARTLWAVVSGGEPQDVIAPALTDNLGLAALYRLLLDHVRCLSAVLHTPAVLSGSHMEGQASSWARGPCGLALSRSCLCLKMVSSDCSCKSCRHGHAQ